MPVQPFCRAGDEMKKNGTKNHEQNQKQKTRRLRLSRETIQVLDPAILELARGQVGANTGSTPGSGAISEGCH